MTNTNLAYYFVSVLDARVSNMVLKDKVAVLKDNRRNGQENK